MLSAPSADISPNTFAYEVQPLVKATGFREYDARWLFGPEINLLGVEALGLGLGTYIQELGHRRIVFMKGQKQISDSESRWGSIVRVAGTLGVAIFPELCV